MPEQKITLDQAKDLYQAQKHMTHESPQTGIPGEQTQDESITIHSLESLCSEIAAQREICDAAAKVKKDQDAKLDTLENKLLETLRGLDKTSYDSRVGKFIVNHRMSVRVPADPESKAAFFAYLRDKGIFESLVTVNSQTLNSFYKNEFEAAKERGEGLDFSLPGIGEPTIAETIQFRRAK